MKQQLHNQPLMTQYLLGELSDQERDELEELYFSDDELFGELLDTEDQLIDDYWRGQLSQPQRKRFEQHFLTLQDRRREVEFSILFAESTAKDRRANLLAPRIEPVPFRWHLLGWLRGSQPIPARAFQIMTLIVILVIASAVTRVSRMREQFEQDQAKQAEQLEQSMKERDGLEQELAALKARAVPATAPLSLALKPGASRGSGEIQRLTPSPGTQIIELVLEAGTDNYDSYQASLHKADDESAEMMIYKRLKATTIKTGKNVIIKIPAAMLEVGDYQIRLEGISPLGGVNIIDKYRFQVRRQ